MKIQFSHTNKNIPAKVIYNFNQVSDVVIVMPEIQQQDLGEYILFHRANKGNWKASETLNNQFPGTAQQLSAILEPVFNLGDKNFNKH